MSQRTFDVFEALEDDLVAREAIGFANHGKPLRWDDRGRDWLTEAYEEALDMAVYLKAELMRREVSAVSFQPSDRAVPLWEPMVSILGGIAVASLVLAIVGGALWSGL